MVSVLVFGDATGLQPALTLIAPNGTALTTTSAQAGAGPAAAELAYRLSEGGVYSLLLGGANGSQGIYFLRFVSRPLPPAVLLPAGGQVDVPITAGEGPQYVTIPADGVPAALNAVADSPDFLYRLIVRRSNGQALADINGLSPIALPLPPDEGGYEIAVSALLPDSAGLVRLALGGPASPVNPPSSNAPVSTPELGPGGECLIAAAGGQINIRSGPGTNFSVIGVLLPGQSLPVIGVNGSWYLVSTQTGEGWISGTVGRLSGDCGNLPFAPGPGQASSTPTVTGSVTVTTTVTTTGTTTATATASPTLPPGVTPTATLSPTASATLAPGITPSATLTPSATSTTPPPTFTSTATATSVQPTVTPTPSYTPTTPPQAQVAPPDANFNSPLNIALDTTASVTDFVSYPGGDTTDRVRWDIIGINQNPALSGGQARLILAVSCFGTGTQNVTFFVAGQTYSCGQTIVDQVVTYNSRTGQVTINAIGGTNTYVQWVLTGTAVRQN